MSLKGNYTAEIVTYARARGSLYRDPAIRSEDYLSRQLLNRPLTLALYPGARFIAQTIYDYLVPGIYLYLLARAKQFDKRVEQLLGEGIEQFLVIGAGYDSRAYRYRRLLNGARVFECDHPTTAATKQERLKRRRIDASHVTFVNMDLMQESLEKQLTNAGFDMNAKTLCIAEGILYYLGKSVVTDNILRFISRTRTGTSFLFDYVLHDVYTDPRHHFGADQLIRYLERKQEPIKSTIEFEKADMFLRPFGLELVSNEKSTSLVDRHLRRSNGRLLGQICALYGLAHAHRV